MKRRIPLLSATALALIALAAAGSPVASPVAAAPAADPLELTILATTDVHGHVYNWDYFANAPYSRPQDILGMAKVGAIVEQTRAAKGADSVILVDNGDTIQGTPLTYYYGSGPGRADVMSGITEHPMATAFNTIGYDAMTVGNHEFNYGLDLLTTFETSLDASLLGANAVKSGSSDPYFSPYTLVDRVIDGETVTVGILGLVTPGVRIWDKSNVEGIIDFEDMVASAKKWVPVVAQQADVVVVLAHTGTGTVADIDYDETALYENVVNNIATQVPGIDVIVSGHTHQDKPQTIYENIAGEKVLVTQPNYWARSVSEVTLNLIPDPANSGAKIVDWVTSAPVVTPHYGKDVIGEDQNVIAALAAQHQTTVDYVNTSVATSVQELSAANSRFEDTAILDFINRVQTEEVTSALRGGAYENVPVLSQASPFSRTAMFPRGEVTIRDMAALYVFDNTLRAVKITGSELKDYLEYSARYFNRVEVGDPFDPATGTNAVAADSPNGIPDYNYDVLSGVNYKIDISQPVGQRISGLSYSNGTPITGNNEFILASNNYRQSGGGGYPHVAEAPIVYNQQQEIRQLLIDWAAAKGTIDPADFFVQNWAIITEPAATAGTELTPLTPGIAGVANQGAPTRLSDTGTEALDALLPAGVLLLLGAALVLGLAGQRFGRRALR